MCRRRADVLEARLPATAESADLAALGVDLGSATHCLGHDAR